MAEPRHIRKFTEKQIQTLAANPFTQRVNSCQISYTLEFKNIFLSLYEQGKTVPEIFNELGYDTEILGSSRMYSFSSRLLKQVEEGKPLTEAPARVRRGPEEGPVKVDYNTQPAQQSLASMQRELIYLRQQVEFLKKLSELDNEKKRRH